MKSIAQKIVVSMSVGALSLGTSLWASSSSDEDNTAKKPIPSFSPPQRKFAQYFSPDKIAALQDEDRSELGSLRLEDSEDPDFNPGPFESAPMLPINRPRTTFEIALAEKQKAASLSPENNDLSEKASSSPVVLSKEKEEKKDSPKMRKKSAKRTQSIKSTDSDSPRQNRKRTASKTKKEFASVEDELLPSSSKATSSKVTLPEVIESIFVEEDESHVPAMKALILSDIVSAPARLTFEEVTKLLAIPLKNPKISLGFSSTLSGDVVTQKEEIQGGLASHKLPAPGVERIAKILAQYPEAIAVLDIDEKRVLHTLSDQGFKGVIGHYYLVQPLEGGMGERLSSSEFSIAFAVKPAASKEPEATLGINTN